MGVAEEINGVLRKQLRCHLAWVPLSNGYALGDYGIFSKGLFTRLGNVGALGMGPLAHDTSGPVRLDFASAGTRVRKLAANAEVEVLPPAAVDATIRVSFAHAGSLLLKAPSIRVQELQELAALIARLDQHPAWRRPYKLVHKVWRAEKAVLFATAEANTEVTVGGSVPALERFALGEVSAELQLSCTHQLGLELFGESGVLGLGLVKSALLTGRPSVLESAAGGSFEEVDATGDLRDDV